MNRKKDNVVMVFEAACDAHWMKDVVQFPNALASELFGKKAVLIARPNNCQEQLKQHIEVCTLDEAIASNNEKFQKQTFSEIETSEHWYEKGISLAAKKGSILIIYPFCGNAFVASRQFKLLRWCRFRRARVILKSDISEYFAAPGSLAFKAKYKATFKSKLRDIANYFFIDRIICENGKVYQNLIHFQKHFTKKLAYIPNCPLDLYSRHEPISYEQKSDTFLFVGRVDDVAKGFDVLINTWKCIYQKIPGWKLLIGGTVSSENRLKWEEILNDENGRASIVWLGYLEPDQLFEFYRKTKVVVCSSRWESGPIVLSEAALSGCAFIGTAAGEIPYVLEGLPGVVNDVKELGKMMQYFSENPDVAESQAQALYNRCKDRIWKEQIKKIGLKKQKNGL